MAPLTDDVAEGDLEDPASLLLVKSRTPMPPLAPDEDADGEGCRLDEDDKEGDILAP